MLSSVIKRGASGDREMCFLLFPQSVPSPNMCICVYYVIGVFVVCVCFVLCRERRRRDRSRHRLITEKVKTDEINVLSLLSSDLR